jgi:hypothetical protein
VLLISLITAIFQLVKVDGEVEVAERLTKELPNSIKSNDDKVREAANRGQRIDNF